MSVNTVIQMLLLQRMGSPSAIPKGECEANCIRRAISNCINPLNMTTLVQLAIVLQNRGRLVHPRSRSSKLVSMRDVNRPALIEDANIFC
jgi:hypothetical protein